MVGPLESLVASMSQGLVRSLAINFGVVPADALDEIGLLLRLGIQMVASASALGASDMTPTGSAGRLASAQRGWRPDAAWSDCEGCSKPSRDRVNSPTSYAAWIMSIELSLFWF